MQESIMSLKQDKKENQQVNNRMTKPFYPKQNKNIKSKEDDRRKEK